MVRLQGRSVQPGYIRVSKTTRNVLSQNGGEEGKPPSGPIETMQCSCDDCRLERWYPPRRLPEFTAQQTTIWCPRPWETLNSKLRSPLQLNPFLCLATRASSLFCPTIFINFHNFKKRLPALLFTLKTFHTNLIKTVVAVIVFVMSVGALSHLWPSSTYNRCWEMRYEWL